MNKNSNKEINKNGWIRAIMEVDKDIDSTKVKSNKVISVANI